MSRKSPGGSSMSASNGFTLLELLTVIVVLVVLITLVSSAFDQIGKASALTGSGQAVEDLLSFARQSALTRNRPVEVRIYKLPDSGGTPSDSPAYYRAMQAFVMDANGPAALTKVISFATGVVISDDVNTSSLLPAASDPNLPEITPTANDPKLPTYNLNYVYRSFQFAPNGATTLPPSASSHDPSWFISLYSLNDPISPSTGLPKNFLTIQLDPQTGLTKVYRP